MSGKNLYVSFAKFLIFLWCIVTKLSLSYKSWKDDDSTIHIVFNAVSSIRFISLLEKLREWNIQTKG